MFRPMFKSRGTHITRLRRWHTIPYQELVKLVTVNHKVKEAPIFLAEDGMLVGKRSIPDYQWLLEQGFIQFAKEEHAYRYRKVGDTFQLSRTDHLLYQERSKKGVQETVEQIMPFEKYLENILPNIPDWQLAFYEWYAEER